MNSQKYDSLVFQHLVDMPNSDCVFCSTLDQETGDLMLFVIFHHKNRIYQRNNVQDAWDELTGEHETRCIREKLEYALRERKVPCYTMNIPLSRW